MKRLGDAELEIMQVIWGTKEPVQASYVQEKLHGHRDWALSAVCTAMNRLVEKAFLACEKRGRSNFYHALISEARYKEEASRSFLDRVYGSSFTGLVAALYSGKAISQEDLAELRKFLDELEGQ